MSQIPLPPFYLLLKFYIFHKKVWDENGQPEWDMLRDDQVTGKFNEVFLWEEFPNLKYLLHKINQTKQNQIKKILI